MDITITNRQQRHPIQEDRIRRSAESVLQDSPFETGMVDVAIVDDQEMHALNLQYLKHDYSTDVLSFVLEQSNSELNGQVVVSADTAASQASGFGWSAYEELLLYVIHGTLHLVGFLDKDPIDAAQMRALETQHLEQLGIHRNESPENIASKATTGLGASPARSDLFQSNFNEGNSGQ